MAIPLLRFTLWLIPLLEDRPPERVFVHITIRILVLGSIIGVIFVGRKLAQRWQKRAGESEEDAE